MNESEGLLNKITNLLIASVEDRKMMMNSMQKLLEDSEKRMDRTNEMVSRLVDACDRMTQCYEEQIMALNKSMALEADENSRLVNLLTLAQQEHIKDDEKFDTLLKSMIEISSPTTANV